MTHVFLHTGSNQGNREINLRKALEYIGLEIGDIIVSSSIYETEAWGIKAQPDFYNQVIHLKTKLNPIELLNKLQSIENKIGKQKAYKWGPRQIDIDILFFDQEVIDTDLLKIPHQQMAKRNFVLIPLAEIAGNLIHPVYNKSINQLLAECRDISQVRSPQKSLLH